MKPHFFNLPLRWQNSVPGVTKCINLSLAQRCLALALAIGSTLLGVFIAACAGWESGGTARDRIVMGAMGLLVVSSSHLLPAFAGRFNGVRRAAILAAWSGCLLYALLGQATFFAFAQRDAGDARATAVNVPNMSEHVDVTPGRSLTAIAQDEAAVVAKLGRAKAANCAAGGCRWSEAREHALAARLAALKVEADEATRREAREDRAAKQADDAHALRESRRADPVAAQLVTLLGWSAASVAVFRANLPAVMLELLPGLFWALVFAGESQVTSAPDAASDQPAPGAPVVAAASVLDNAPDAAGPKATVRRPSPVDEDLLTALKAAARLWDVSKSLALRMRRHYAARFGVVSK